MEEQTQTLAATTPNKMIWVLKVEQPDLPDFYLTYQQFMDALDPDESLGFCVAMAMDGDYKSDSVLFTVSAVQMDEQEFNNLPEWEG